MATIHATLQGILPGYGHRKQSPMDPVRRQPLPKQCDGKYCAYRLRYEDESYTYGILAKETFFLSTDTRNTRNAELVENIVFGCGMNNSMDSGDEKKNKIAGIMGLGWGPLSFVTQIDSRSNGKFSYCLPVINLFTPPRPGSHLRFGADIPERENSSNTTLQRIKDQKPYYVKLQGISLNGLRLDIPPSVFGLKENGSRIREGCIIDSGTAYSRIIRPAYDIFQGELQKYFSNFKNMNRCSGGLGLDLCYEREKAEGFNNLPTITFHFQGKNSDLVLMPEGSFEVVDRRQFSYQS
ncbi:hypothetical protein F0562_021352 [Nyssa sinensis]|uniref:Peptidase A1 domain-containing protein n=1 Tax=Nyssa sinensis TaxID=561372 RepID=A0A5J5BJ46_9ASTE|nr:hypothetical protein F0562_021352 [Nyssa sinensis]